MTAGRGVPRLMRCALAGALAGLAATAVAGPGEQHAAQGATVNYVTQSGDTLYNVAERYLRESADWRELARINAIGAPRRLQPGLTLRLPVALLREDNLTALVVSTSGPASHAFRKEPALPLTAGSTLVEGDRIRTGADGFVSLEFADGTHLVIPPHSSLDLATLKRTVLTGTTDRVIDLRRGEVDSEVTHATRKDDRFQIRSPSVVAGVRGTQFRVTYDERGATAVEVLDGAVGVDPAGTAAAAPGVPLQASAQLVAAHHGSLTRAGGSVGVPVVLLDAPTLNDPGKVEDGDDVSFALAPVTGAQGYHVRVARDAGLLDLVRDTRSDTAHISLGDLPDGNWFARFSAIDADGLEGMPGTYAFARRRLGLQTSAGHVDGTHDYLFRWAVDRHAERTRFRFVLAANPELRQPLIDRPGLANGEMVVHDLPRGVYYWTVIAEQVDDARLFEKASPVQSFRLDW